jgi:hypothetical protein
MKKMIKYIAVGLLTAPIFMMSSCQKDINEINETNPNAFNDSDPKLMITGAQLANVMLNEGEAARLAGIFAGHFTGYDRQYVSFGLYNMNAGDFNTPWGTLYAEGIAQCRIIRSKAAASNDQTLEASASVTEAHLLLTASSLWGNIPNTQACSGNPTPTFDKMSDVYDYCIVLLDSAISKGGASSAYSSAYAGSFTWGEVANTLKARAYLHKKDYAKAIDAAKNGISKGNDFYAKHETESPGAWNLYYDFLDYNRPGYISCENSFIHALLDSTSAKYKGNTKTKEASRYENYFLIDNYTPVDPNMYTGIFAPTSNFALVSYVENQLILAECYWRTSVFDKALESLNNVRSEHESNFGGYEQYVSGDFANNDALLKEIITEKYVSLFGSIEVFNDVRRTQNLIGVPINSGNKLPGRFLYPQSEMNSNKNTPTATLFDVLELFQ